MTERAIAERTLYRLVRTLPSTTEDFLSAEALGRPQRPQESAAIWSGLSMWATEAQARRQFRRFPILGRFAAILILNDEELAIEKTFGPGHYTVWGTPDALLSAVIEVIPLAELPGETPHTAEDS